MPDAQNSKSIAALLVASFALAAPGCGGALDEEDPDMRRRRYAPDASPLDLGDAGGLDMGTPPSDMSGPDMTPSGPAPNEGWIGGACASRADCDFEGALCLGDDAGYPGGTCSTPCEKYCPDRDGANHSVTFCAPTDSGGRCVSRCDWDLFEERGCREGYRCVLTTRFGGTYETGACLPDEGPPSMGSTACLRALDELGVVWSPWSYTATSPEGRSDLVCSIDDPIKVEPRINGVSYRYYSSDSGRTIRMSCPLALALHDLGDVLREYDITEVLDVGYYNCRTISGTDRLSQHAHGLAIDIYGFVDAHGEDYILERDWEHDTTEFGDRKARVLYEIAQRMYEEKIFHNILTPNYNAGHDNHYHLDLAPGAHFIGQTRLPSFWIGNDRNLCSNIDVDLTQ
jgi:hypothetical protein